MSQHNQQKTRIGLPSGGEIQVRRFERPPEEARELHVCPSCVSELVQPTSWSPSPGGRFTLRLECPNCGWWESGVYDRAQVERLEDRLDEGLLALIDDLHRLTQANMASDVDRFIDALNFDLILPEDF